MASVELIELLQIPKHRGIKAALVLQRVTAEGAPPFVICGLTTEPATGGGELSDLAIVIGKGPTVGAALADAQSSLQSALDVVDLQILRESRKH